ncbi:putative mutase [Carbonactinospora thermoautotrophica]|uniref:Putative mutase n=1 Tax=Carbonactinospora thermoautotrophica TaxID=1469144 RepID=A0A132MUI4_9ACTN|nr:putative mutase [Carbonactinospora thermoautotrophica]
MRAFSVLGRAVATRRRLARAASADVYPALLRRCPPVPAPLGARRRRVSAG